MSLARSVAAAARARALAARASPAALILAVGACSGPCDRAATNRDAAPPPDAAAVEAPRLALPPAQLAAVGSFEPVRARPFVALPDHCSARAPALRARVGGAVRLAADPTAPGAFAFAEVGDGGGPPVRAAGLVVDPGGAASATPIAWPATTPPLVARSPVRGWVVATSLPGPTTSARVALARGADAVLVGAGDGFEAVDLACSAPTAAPDGGPPVRRCALLTTRLAGVAAPGADLWFGDDVATAPWTRVPIGEGTEGAAAQPIAIARAPGPDGRGAVAVLMAAGELAFWEVSPEGARPFGVLPAPFGLIDVIAAPRPVAMTYGARHDQGGCTEDGGRLRFERAGLAAIEIRTPTPPVSGWLRPLERGYLATWLAPLACGAPRRVVFAAVLDADGAPLAAPTAVSDGSAVAIATRAGEVDLWIAHDDSISWVRAFCAAP